MITGEDLLQCKLDKIKEHVDKMHELDKPKSYASYRNSIWLHTLDQLKSKEEFKQLRKLLDD